MKNLGEPPKPTLHEKEAAGLAMEAVGTAIEATGTTDLTRMDVEQFQSVILAAYTHTALRVRELTDKNAVPF